LFLTELVDVVKAVIEAKKRIIPDIVDAPGFTYFGARDSWLYFEFDDARICPECRSWGTITVYQGNHLRDKFPFLEVISRDRIQVNVHPNCRCYLRRMVEE
jgi:hypothetical protein